MKRYLKELDLTKKQFCQNGFILEGRFSGNVWKCSKNCLISGEGANIFELYMIDKNRNILKDK